MNVDLVTFFVTEIAYFCVSVTNFVTEIVHSEVRGLFKVYPSQKT